MRPEHHRPTALLALSVLIVSVFAGCEDNPLGRRALSGLVTLDGQPLVKGNIEFAPTQPGGVSSGAAVLHGRYDIPRLKGLPPGQYLVRIFAAQATTAPRTPEEAALPAAHWPGAEQIAARYNTASELTVQVADDDPSAFNFDVHSPGAAP